ncbi:LacI family DNA-binding transcriptional regulator [Cellulomonas sp. HZM]|uniref:LacI family DNA-binding transcriptional regulator n=1 Tax=Cellulomonas sp. HZM TaxID=1454010 RepID=UPI0004932155|nr:LacI family DNA-binding transcriptional regulator [Cellulomonas sp. HZM]
MARLTSADVARESGVSRTTVSYVLNGKTGVAIPEATRQRVREAAERLGYTPSAAARALRRGRSDLVLLVLPDWTVGPVIDTLLDHLTAELAERGLSLLVHHDRGPRRLADLWGAVTPRAVLGLVPFAADDAHAMRQAGIQVVGSTLDADPEPGTFSVPQREIGRLQVEHLAARGHRVLAYAAPSDERLAEFADRRAAGAAAACERLGLPAPAVRAVGLDVTSASAAVQEWRAGDEPVTAVAAYNDEVALAVLAGLRAEGLSAPADIAVIGVDDVPVAALAAPPLTTVWQNIDAQATYLAASVLAALDGADEPERPDDVFHVVVRAST